MNTCVIEGCEKPARSSSAEWCKMHYHRWYRHGDPHKVRAAVPKAPKPRDWNCMVCGVRVIRKTRVGTRCADHRKHRQFDCGTCGKKFWSNRHTSTGSHFCSQPCSRRPNRRPAAQNPRIGATKRRAACNPALIPAEPEWLTRRIAKLEWKQCVCGKWICQPGRKLCGSQECKRQYQNRHATQQRRRRGILGNHCGTCGTKVAHPQRFCSEHREAALKASRHRMTLRSRAKYGTTYRSRARKYGVEYQPVNKQRVFARDGWRCGICGKKVDQRLKDRHPMMASLDHIVPMALGGDHTYINTQCTHLCCNLRKSHRSTGDQLALVG